MSGWCCTGEAGDVTGLTYDAALDEALCFGWIDGQVGKRDAGSMFGRFTPRTKRSQWSSRNVGHIARLTEEGRMHPAGLADVLTSGNRYALSWRLGQVKRPATRAKKIDEFVAMLARHETIHPQKKRPS